MLLQFVPSARGSLPQIAQGTMANSGFRHLQGQNTSLNGLNAYVGVYQGQMQGLGNVVTMAAHVVHGRNVYVFAGLAPANQFEGVQSEFTSSIRSFRQLSASEAASIRPNRVDLHTVRGGETWQSIAERSGGLVKPATLAIMNNYEPGQRPRAGDRIRIVVAG